MLAWSDETQNRGTLVYDPERFVGMDVDFRGQDFWFLPFGNERRGCSGFPFGSVIVPFSLGTPEWPSGIGPSDDLQEIFGLTTREKTALKLVPTKNKNHRALQ
ncbi:hypothetical protein L1987_11282 [Smallanthus sonchifolius]|uniref:Uncharacterized protein n=1 Tax=Smallanthus sonchifolius TaxID=185202 RepID=A0ACB9JD59_9ASTR|nr:hypothetical protein L1987_11282 [Smallanthus sonchifolius]